MTSEEFLSHLQEHAASFAKAIATNEGEWIIKGFIDIYLEVGRPYTDLKSYFAYKQRGRETLQQFQDQIEQLAEETSPTDEEETE